MRQYILDKNNKPILEPDLVKWGKWFENHENRIVKQEDVNGCHVSTVFLGLDHSWDESGPPILWETMIFGGKHDEYQQRYNTYNGALLGHKYAVQLAMED